ncbi:MAG: signal peptide peptidase SppA, partial [Planctomycetes bacterium]|nr:signal peptide peptidase SppA [Planctomycetota bacterium]
IVASVSARRGLDIEQVRELQKKRMLDAASAKAAGLVDEVVPWRGARLSVATDDDTTFKNVGKKEKKKGISLMSLLTGGSSSSKTRVNKDSIVVLQLSGTIMDGKAASPGSMVSGSTVKLVRELADNEKVKGVVVRVNSPGGSATASEAILLALRDLAKTKPVVVSMGELAASGGYYISMIGNGCKVFAEAETITGSIGVFGMRPNVGKLANTLGVHQEMVTLDPDAAGMDDLFSPLSAAQLDRLQDMVNTVYTRFQDRILEARKMSRDDLLKIAGGRVWSGAQARELGLVDALGGLGEAMATLEAKAGAGHAVVHFPKPDSNPLGALGSLLGAHIQNAQSRVALLAQAGFKLEGPLRILLDALRNPRATRVWMMIPAELRIR